MPEATDDEDNIFVPSNQSDNSQAEWEHECDKFSPEGMNLIATQWVTVQ